MVVDGELLAAEDAGWGEFHTLMDSLSAEQAERPGYFPEGWSAKDALGHVGSWLAEAAVILERIRGGTYRPDEIDVDAMNDHFLDVQRGVPLPVVRAQAWSARTRMLQAWAALPDLTAEGRFWIRKSGAEHYEEHLPRLREWVAELQGTEEE
jgi:Mycothiol maleylpyruvate isomerase N-terminal domain